MVLFRFLIALLLAGLSLPSSAAEPDRPKPLVVMIETDPWLMVIGSDSPAFALYDNGDLIYWRDEGYRFVHLDRDATDALVQSMHLDAAAGKKGSFETSDATDQPEHYFFVFDRDPAWAIRVYGQMARSGTKLDGPLHSRDVPPEVQTLYDAIATFDDPEARDWLPEKVEVMIWPYDYAPDASIHWPADWPGLDAPDTRKRQEDSYSLFVPSDKMAELRAFLSTRKEKGAVEIGGKKWAVSLRLPFPGEEKWMGGGE